MTEAEQKALADAELLEAIKKERDELLADKKVAENEKGLLAIGYDEKLAAEVAKALYSGDTATVLAAQAKFIEAQKKEALANAVKDTPTPPVDNGNGVVMTKEKLQAMSVQDRFEFSQKNPEEYKKIYGG
jgi:DNA replication initiation complex subunit (GINS family)